MEENTQQNESQQDAANALFSGSGDKGIQEEKGGNRPNNRIAKVIEWLNRNYKGSQLVINFLLMIGTFLLFWKATSQSDAAIKAATVADNTFKENQREFILSTTPYLQITDIYDTLKTGEKPIFNYKIQNMGKEPVKILSGEIGILINTKSPEYPFNNYPNFKPNPLLINVYAIKESPYIGQWKSDSILTKETYDSIEHNQYFIYFFGRIKYINQADTPNEKEYDFNVQIFQQPRMGALFLYNENK